MLAGIRAGGNYLCRLPNHLFKVISGYVTKAEPKRLVRLTVAGAAQVGIFSLYLRHAQIAKIDLLLPVELLHVNHAASTNLIILPASIGACI